MHADDMSIFWNQNKGQYEPRGNNYYKQDNTFTRTADQRLKYQESSYSEAKNSDDLDDSSIVKLESWLGTLFLMLVPGLNVIFTIVLAISSKSPTKKAFARALLLLFLILLTICLIFMVLTYEKIDYKSIMDSALSLIPKCLGVLKRLF